MRFCCIIILAAAALGSAQVLSIGVKPAEPVVSSLSNGGGASDKAQPAAGAPLFGYVVGPDSAELHPIIGRINTPVLGERVALAEDARNLFLPPRQLYVLIEKSSDDSLVVLDLPAALTGAIKQSGMTIAGALSRPDLVSFSPRGTASALYSQTEGRLQIVNHLPSQPVVSRQLSVLGLGVPSRIELSDDAELVLAEFADEGWMFSLSGASWMALPIGFTPRALSFVPNTHDVAFIDIAQSAIVLLPKVEDAASTYQTVAQNIRADRLSVTKDGEHIVVANSDAGQIWTIAVKTGVVTAKEGAWNVQALSTLRDGFTFLISSSPGVALLRLSASPAMVDPAILAQTSNGKD